MEEGREARRRTKRAEQLVETARSSIGLTEGLTAAKIEIKALLEQYEMFARQLEEILFEVEQLLEQIPGTKEMLTFRAWQWLPWRGSLQK
ncbi:hypothetical protein [Paenibacillus sp. FSL H7-0357]|uniref:hypothetical protein n=1 Tax=Paenibacillus sp. FSL H7-0357 TaxID=1536774 RepID=UPI000B06C177